MSRVLIVTRHFNNAPPQTVFQMLRNFGIPAEIALCDGTSSTAFKAGNLVASPADPAVRNYLRQYDAIFVFDNATVTATAPDVASSLAWLTWNDPEDPPVFYFGIGLQTTRTGINSFLPTDFPIVRPNPTNLNATAYLADANATLGIIGSRFYFQREQKILSILGFNLRNNFTPYYWKLDLDKHFALNSAGEVLLAPNYPDQTFPADCIAGYRYHNRYLLPMLYLINTDIVRTYFPPFNNQSAFQHLFWVLYALKLAGIRPAWRIPLHFETDHPLQLGDTRVDGMTFVQQLTILRDTLDWVVGFCERTGLVVHHGIQVGGRDRTRTAGPASYDHWVLLNRSDLIGSEAVAIAQQAHAILLAHHTKTQPCGPHDHTMPNNALNLNGRNLFTFKRHTGGFYGAPNSVPIEHGIVLHKRYAPTNFVGLEYTLDDQVWIETAMPMSGTGTSISNAIDGSYHLARIVVEGHIDELRAMGFPDGTGGEHGYTNTAKNSSGGLGYWQAYRDAGYRGIRSHHCANDPNGRYTVPPSGFWKGFHFLPQNNLDGHGTSSQGGYGLYHPTAPSQAHAVGGWSLDSGGDIVSDYPATAYRAYRRLLALHLSYWLATSVLKLGASYLHTVTCFGASPSKPTARFSEFVPNLSGLPAYNHFVELLCEMEPIVQVLSDYLYFGSVSDLFAVRERVYG